MDSSSSSTTVEYHDPAGVFPLIARELTNRLPLRNLNWQSHARPLRQIKHLHVDFVPSQDTLAALQPQAKNGDQAATSIDILRSGFEAPKQSTKAIRHQIAGLKATPYLKLYILRCDDKEWYKQEERRRLKEWVSEIKQEDGRQEQHDAAEWLIVHVVIPDTIAASEPRWRESSRDPDELKERSKANGAKWPGKSGKTMLDRLRADFNDKGKDHIAQIRLSKSQIAVDLLPVPAMAKTIEETADEREKSWADLMLKIRASILSSFDARVRQYEEDIAEQEARRSMPGWNFCTFFINKEGLAKSLESVGLVEDALAIYDELSLDLETVLTDIATGQAAQMATSFSITGSDIISRITRDAEPQRLFTKDYRGEIVRSAISAFDFFCYLFERQISLILRLAGRTIAFGTKEGGDDLVMLAEVCWRGLNFIHNGARLLKQDLYTQLPFVEAQALVLSWTFAAGEFVLERTQSSHMDLTDAGIKSPGKATNTSTQAPKREFGFSMGADAYPQRNSSLGMRKIPPAITEIKSVASASSAGKVSEDGFLSPPSSSGGDGLKILEVPGLAELAAYRAELIVLERKTLDLLAVGKGWRAGWAALRPAPKASEVKVTLSHEVETMLCMKEAYESKYEVLTDRAARHYLLATHQKSAENLMGDLAVLKYSQGDYGSAATYFEHVMPMFEADGWQDIQMKALALHIDCLCKLERWSDAVSASLDLLGHVTLRSDLDRKRLDASVLAAASWENIMMISRQLETPLMVSTSRFFGDIHFGHCISHAEDSDGFLYTFSVQLLTQTLNIDHIKLHLEHVDHPDTALSMVGKATGLQYGSNDVTVASTTTTYGMFAVHRLELAAGNLLFRHELAPQRPMNGIQLTDREPQENPKEKRPCLLLYPAPNAMAMRMMPSRNTTVTKARFLEILLKTGHNDVDSAEVRLKPETAGLRLHCNDAYASGVDTRSDQPGTITLGKLQQSTTVSVFVRYTLEQVVPEIGVFADMQFNTAAGVYNAMQHYKIAALLPLDVEVKDAFHLGSLLSTFTIRSTNTQPVILEDIKLNDSQAYSVLSPGTTMPAVVLPQQPVESLHKIARRRALGGLTKQDAALELIVDYWPIGDLVRATIAKQMRASLAKSEFGTLRRLVMPLLLSRCLRSLNDADMHTAALTDETKVPSFADLGWYDIVDMLPDVQQRPLSDWLMQWHIKHQRMTLTKDVSTPRKQITITVDVPTIDHVFLASVSVIGPQDILRQGELAEAQLKIQYTRRWQGSGQTKSSRRPDFVYELLVDPNVWLISGSRRVNFTAEEEDGSISAKIQLLPLKTGRWALPSVGIRPVLDEDSKVEVSCEASCMSAGHLVQIVGSQPKTRAVAVNYEGEPRPPLMPVV